MPALVWRFASVLAGVSPAPSRCFLAALLAGAGLLGGGPAGAGPAARAAEPAPGRPNIVVILTDDQGYGDLGCYGATEVATPHLDRMAAEGMRFTDFYVAAPFCSPSRAALLTGRLPVRCGVPYVLFPTEHTGLPPEEITLAEMLRSAGYATALVGKWHLGWRRELRPQRQGFDEFYGLWHTNDVEEWRVGAPFRQLSVFAPLALRDGDRVVEAPVEQAQLTARYTQRAQDFIRRHRERPFFLLLSHTMPHVPQYASPAFSGRSRGGLYGDAIEELDASTGALLAELRRLGLAEKTLVIFLSDNGAAPRPAGARAAKKGGEGSRFPGRAFGGSNGPLRGGKGQTFEGGIRVPCLAWWPGTVPAGRVESTPGSALDLWPTLTRFAGVTPPRGLILDGVDLSRVLRGEGAEAALASRLLVHYFGPQLQAVREGPWKLILPVTAYPARREPSLWFAHQPALYERQHRLWPQPTLYHLPTDRGETTDVAARHPDLVERLRRRAQAFDAALQPQLSPVRYLPGPRPPAPGQIRQEQDDLTPWRELLQ